MCRTKLLSLVIGCVMIAGWSTDAVPAPVQWTDPGTDDWMVGSNWSPFPPGAGDSVDISNGGTAYLATDTIALYTISHLVLGDPFGQSGTLELRPGAKLAANNFVVVGGNGMGQVQHLAGLLGTDTLAVGAGMTGVGSYDMVGGQVDAFRLIVGDSGLGSFDQQGGFVDLGYGGLSIGRSPFGVGTYSLSGPSQLSVDGSMRVGERGLGSFVQDGGQVSVTGGPLSVGFEAGASGSYQISFGILQADELLIGERGAGLFTHENGAVRAQRLTMGSEATGAGDYTLAGGSLLVEDSAVIGSQGDGSFIQTGGIANLGRSGGPVLVLGQFAGSSATYHLEGAASQLNLNGGMILGSEGSGTFTQQGGSLTGDFLVLGERFSGPQPASGSYALSGGNVRLDQNLIVGFEGVGSFSQSGGRVWTEYLDLGYLSTGPDTSRGSYDISGGELNAEFDMTVGRSGIGTVEQTRGSVVVGGALELARYSSSQGTYSISGGTLDTAEIRFGYGDGTFTVSVTGAVTTGNIEGSDRGTLIVDGGSLTNYGAIQDVRTFILGSEAGSNGAYTSINHTSVTETFVVGDAGRGHYTQQSGATYGPGGSPAAIFVVGNGAASEGTITVQDGGFYYDELIVGKAGTGAYEQFKGSAQGEILSLGTEATGQGTVHVHGDQFQAQEVYVGGLGTAAFHQDGGVVSVYSLLVLGDTAGREGTYNLSRPLGGPIPELQVQGALIVGAKGTGTFNHDGGYVRSFDSSHLLILGDHAGSQGTYNLTGPPTDADPPGMVDSQGMLIVGGAGTGTFNQTDGFTRVVFRQEVVLGAGPGSHGTYNLNGSGPALPPASLSATDRLAVGRYGTGVFHHQGAENASVFVGEDLFLGEFAGSQGTYEMTIAEIGVSGPTYQLNVNGNLFVGMGGIGAYHQTGGQSSFNSIHLGSQPTGQGTLTLTDGLIETGPVYVGASGGAPGSPGATGVVVQDGGRLWAQGPVYIGRDPGAHGSYTLIDGALEGSYLWVGHNGQGEFDQQGGAVDVQSFVRVGYRGEGEYRMAGGALNAASLTVGVYGDGTFVQQGGDVLIQNQVTLSESSDSGVHSTGRYSISGGSLQAYTLFIGQAGAGEFSQSGGDVVVQQGVYLEGTSELSGNYTMTGGTLSAGFVQIGDGRALTISNGSQAETGTVYLAQPSWMTGRIAVANGSSWTNHGSLTLGDFGTATLEVSGGSTVDGAAPIMMASGFPSTANVTVDGNGSRLLTDGYITVAKDGTANVTVSGGGQIRSNQWIVLSEGSPAARPSRSAARALRFPPRAASVWLSRAPPTW